MNGLFTLDGRIKRSTYIWTTIIVTIIMYGIFMMAGLFLGVTGGNEATASAIGGLIGLVGTVVIGMAAVKRLHDLDRPGAQYWLFLVPLYNIYLGFMLLFHKGTNGANRFGGDPCTS